jgi:hypothetical protein
MKINLDIVNHVTCKHAKLYYKIICIVGYTNITKSDKFVDLKIDILRSIRLLFLYNTKYDVFEHDFLHVCGINSWLHVNIFYIFLKLRNMVFDLFIL